MNQIKPLALKPGDKITIYGVSDMMACTMRTEATVFELFSEPEFVPAYTGQQPSLSGTWRFGTMRIKGKRSLHYLSIRPEKDLVVLGWNRLGRDVDAYNSFSGNACLNIAASVEDVKKMVEWGVNPNFCRHDIIMAAPQPWTEGPYMPVYPDHPTDHAVVQKIREEVKR